MCFREPYMTLQLEELKKEGITLVVISGKEGLGKF